MARFWDGGFPVYVSVGQRRAESILEARRLAKGGRKLEPVRLDGTKIAASFWGKAWCKNLERYADLANRIPRGRTYLRHGAVVDLRIAEGRVDALVNGSSLYEVSVEIDPLTRPRARALASTCKGRIDSMVALLQGELPEELVAAMVKPGSGLFPEPKQMRFACSCPDYAEVCKHVAAVLYGVGARFDERPETFFTLRSVKLDELLAKSARPPAAPAQPRKGRAALEQIFGIELDAAPPRAKRMAVVTPPVSSTSRGGRARR